MSKNPHDQVSASSHLPLHETQGWVKLDGHLIRLVWKVAEAMYLTARNKAFCERVAAEAALMKGQTEVIIRYQELCKQLY